MAFMIALAKILRTKNTCCWRSSKNRQVIYENQLIDDGYTWHLLCAKLSYHDII